MYHQEFEVPEPVSDAIKCFWYNKEDFGEQETVFEVVPDGYAEIIFYFGELGYAASNENIQTLPSPFMMGLLNQPAHFHTKDKLEIIGVRCFPWTVFDLLNLPPRKDGVQVFKHPVAALQPALHTCILEENIDAAIALLTQYFLNARMGIAASNMLHKAGIAMRKANGTIAVSRVAASAHATVRTLERKFRQSSGYTVKDVAALMRFEQVRNQLWLHPETNLAGLALEAGYADQAHLSKEFKRYSGTTPAAFARNARKRKAAGNDFVAFVQD